MFHEQAEKTACGMWLAGVDPIELGYKTLDNITCQRCRHIPGERSVTVVMKIPKSADWADLQTAADYIRENGVIPDFLREGVAECIANAIPKTPAWVKEVPIEEVREETWQQVRQADAEEWGRRFEAAAIRRADLPF